MTQQIVAHKTSDGRIFEDEALAEEHELRLASMRHLTTLCSTHRFPLVISSFDVSDLVEYMVDNREAFLRAFDGLAPETPVIEDEGPSSDDDAEIEAASIETAMAEAGFVRVAGEYIPADEIEDDLGDPVGDAIDDKEIREQTEPRAADDAPF